MRYSRIRNLPGIGEEGMKRLSEGRVLVVGCGALGSMCAMQLAASGVGTVGIADFDTVDISNLQRQLFYTEECVGKAKCRQLAERMRSLNSTITIEEHETLLDRKKSESLFGNYDFIIDGSDNAATKGMVAEVCEKMGIPYCIGGVSGYGGQAMSWLPGHAGYAEIFGDVESAPGAAGMLPCAGAPVLGSAAAIVASVQASEAIKHLAGTGKMLLDKLFVFDLAQASAMVL